MSVTQTVDIPASHSANKFGETIDVPREVPVGPTVLTFTPKPEAESDGDSYPVETGVGCPICEAHRDPVTGEEMFNARVLASFEEGDAMLRGDIPATWHTSLDDLDTLLGLK